MTLICKISLHLTFPDWHVKDGVIMRKFLEYVRIGITRSAKDSAIYTVAINGISIIFYLILIWKGRRSKIFLYEGQGALTIFIRTPMIEENLSGKIRILCVFAS